MNLRHALKWSFLTELAAKLIQPIVFIVLARLLTPEDFGVMAAALMVLGFSQVFWEAGMGKALIQRQSNVDAAADIAFWVNITLGVAIGGLLFLSAERIAGHIFHDDRVTAVIRVMSLQVLLAATGSVHTALLQKAMGFKKLFWVRFATIGLPGLASIPLAWNGMGYWALVGGMLLGQAAQVVMLWSMSEWRPRLLFDRLIASEMVGFGVWVGASGLLAWFYVWADSLVVGMHLGSHELGLYRTGNQFAGIIFGMLFGPIAPVLYSHLSRMNQDRNRMRRATARVIKVITYVAIPVAVIVYTLSDHVAGTLFGPKWEGIGLVIGVMALTQGFAWIVGLNGEVYRAMGKPSYETNVMAATIAIYLAAYLYSIRFGLEIFVWTRLGLALAGVLLQLVVIRKLLKLPVVPLLLQIGLTASVSFAIVYGLNELLRYPFGGQWTDLGVRFLIYLLVIGSTLTFLERNGLVRDLRDMIAQPAALSTER